MAPFSLKPRRVLGTLPVAALLVGLFVALVLMRDAVQNSEELSRAFVPLLFSVLGGLLLLVVLVAVNVVKLVRRYRSQAAGSRLTLRIVVQFVLISLLPVAVVYYFSLGFLLRGIDSWFDVELDRAMQDALALNQASLDMNQRVLVRYTEQLLAGIEDRSATAIALTLSGMRRQAGAEELTVYGRGGQVLATANQDPAKLVPSQPEQAIQQEVRAGNNHVGLEARGAGDLVVRVVVGDPDGRPMQMQGIFPTSSRIGELSGRLETAFNRYRELAFLRRSLKLSFSLTLSLVLLFGVMAALIAAFHTARRLVAPVADIARGTRAIAAGDYEQQLPLPKQDDELAFLVASFNTMSRRIAQARDEADRSKQEVETQRAYLETVLGRLSSGVVAFDDAQRLRTANPAACQILGMQIGRGEAPSLSALLEVKPWLAPWADSVADHMRDGGDWREEMALQRPQGRQTLMCRGSDLPLPGIEQQGHVVVFDDITTLIIAQRDAAWGEVARRLAHEIKNPLTPIQLSAERLRHKLLTKVPEQESRLVDRATGTIIQQVEAMKSMVNDFSDYARSPRSEPEPLVLDALVRAVLDLYRSAGHQAVIADLGVPGVEVMGDATRLRQVIHNLVKNALEALEGVADGRVEVMTALAEGTDLGFEQVELVVEDNGPGFDEGLKDRVFEPYVTSKTKGTGLGLAIVKKIIEEHGGMITAENTPNGALIRIRLPVRQKETGPAPGESGQHAAS